MLRSKNLMNCCCQLHANYVQKQSFCLHFPDSIKLMSQTHEVLLYNQNRREKKILDWQLFRNLETACKYDPKKNKSQRLLSNQNLLSVEGLQDGTKFRVHLWKVVAFWSNLPSISLMTKVSCSNSSYFEGGTRETEKLLQLV